MFSQFLQFIELLINNLDVIYIAWVLLKLAVSTQDMHLTQHVSDTNGHSFDMY